MKRYMGIGIFVILTTVKIFSQDAATINSAISSGDCTTLYKYVNDETINKEQSLVNSANSTIRRYVSIDSSTSKYRTNRMDSRVRNVGKDLVEKIFIEPENTLPAVVTKLISGLSDQYQKVKVLHDWICDNIAYDVETAFERGINRPQDYVSVLKNRKAICSGYTNLFNQMCRLASIESIGISGYSKGFGYKGYIGANPDHDWNAVRVNNKWFLVDVTWDAGHVDYKTYIKNYSTDYLFLDSRPFLYSHLPEEDKYQFYAPVIDSSQFEEEPYIAGVYFRYGLELKSDLPHYNNAISDGFKFDLGIRNTNVNLTSIVRTEQDVGISGASWQGKSGSTVSFIYDVPDTQQYKGIVFARMNNDKRIQERLNINLFETKILPELDALVQTKKITEKEKEYFINSYFKVLENGNYYYIEDQFDTPRINAVLKIHPLVELSLEMLEPVLTFNIRAASGYLGYKANYSKRFPDSFSAFKDASNTKLVSPINGELKVGSTENFVIESKDYTKLAIVIDEQFTFFEKNQAGVFELSFTIPEGLSEIQIFGTKNNRNYNGLLKYGIIE
jgi:transglutaminase-like putative cysteine protease